MNPPYTRRMVPGTGRDASEIQTTEDGTRIGWGERSEAQRLSLTPTYCTESPPYVGSIKNGSVRKTSGGIRFAGSALRELIATPELKRLHAQFPKSS